MCAFILREIRCSGREKKKIIMGCFAICNATQAFPAFPKRIDIVALNLPVL